MVAYTLTKFDNETDFDPEPAVDVDTASDGTPFTRLIQAKQVYNVTLVHSMLSAAEATALAELYEDNSTAQIDVVYNSFTYYLRFRGKPNIKAMHGDTWWSAVVKMRGLRSDNK